MTKGEKVAAMKNGMYGLIFLAALLLAGINGCGYKTMPVPPEEVVPKAITDLRYELDQQGVKLSWTYPEKSLRGDELTDITDFKLFRAVVKADKYCETCPIPFGEPVMLEGGAVVQGKPKTGEYTATLLRPGHLYFFKLRSASGWWAESADSNVVSFMWDVPPATPEAVSATAADRSVTIRWEPVSKHVDGTPVTEAINYQVFRNSGSGAFVAVGQPVTGTEYVDSQVVNDKKYQYKVQALTVYKKGQVGGGMSTVAEAITVDRTPPPSPTGVQGIRTARGVKIIWDRVKAPDVRGYRIYRRLPDENKSVMVGDVGVAVTIFDDSGMDEADSWFYSVTSYDTAQPSNESDPSPEVNVRN